MSELIVSRLQPERVMAIGSEMRRVDRFIAFDEGLRERGHAIRRSASPEFMITIVTEVSGDIVEDDYVANIVACNVPDGDTTKIPSGTPVAIAEVEIDGTYWYLMIRTMQVTGQTELHLSDVLVQCDEEPEGLLERSDLFDPTDD